ncbi:MAG: glutamate mutase L, partial [Limnochordia bacterium]
MERKFVLIDIGSTFTKVTAVDLAAAEIVARASAPTTPTDVSVGLRMGLEALVLPEEQIAVSRKLACSSAAGGLRMVAIGLVE